MATISRSIRAFLAPLMGLPAETLNSVLAFHSNTAGVSMDTLKGYMETIAAEKGEAAKKSAKALKTALAMEARKALHEKVCKASILSAPSYVWEVEALGGFVVLNADETFTTTLKISGKTGAGRPRSDSPTGYQDWHTGEEILGSVVSFAKKLEKEGDIDLADNPLCYTKSGKLKPAAGLIDALGNYSLIEPVA